MQRYEKYKDSGVDWIGEIPKHWECKRLGTWFTERREKVSDKDYAPLSVTKNGVVPQLDNAAKSNDGDNRKLVKDGDFVINSRSDRKGSSGLSVLDGSVSLINIVMKPRNIDGKFAQYLLKSRAFVEEFYRNGHGIVADLWTTRFDEMKFINISVPPLEEQQTIATFLDDKTSKIDQTIANKQKEIELLKERRQILIQKAVTKGLDDTVPLKDSGVDWIGKIPEHWEVRKLMGLCRFVRGNSPFGKDELLNVGEYVAMQYGKTYKVNEVNEDYNYYVNNEFYKDSQVVNYGDVIMISTSETIEDLGHTVYYRRNDAGLLGGEQLMLKPKQEKINSQYLYFTSKLFSKELRKFATGIKVFRFNINDLKTIFTALPPLSEQNKIANYIETQSTKIAKAILLKQQEIEKVKEYKTVLVENVVTGKVKIN